MPFRFAWRLMILRREGEIRREPGSSAEFDKVDWKQMLFWEVRLEQEWILRVGNGEKFKDGRLESEDSGRKV